MSAIDFFRRGRPSTSSPAASRRSSMPTLFDPQSSVGGDWGRAFEDMERMMQQMMRSSLFREDDMIAMMPDVDENETSYMLSFDMPGVSPEDVNIEIAGNQLTIRGERKQEQQGREGRTVSRNRTYGRFQESLYLPENVDPDKIEAQFEHGVLHLSIPKSEPASVRKIEVHEGRGRAGSLTSSPDQGAVKTGEREQSDKQSPSESKVS